MYRGHTIAVVVPAYNESGFVGEVIETVPTYVDRVYVVDDCSTDDTWAEIVSYVPDASGSRSGDLPVETWRGHRVVDAGGSAGDARADGGSEAVESSPDSIGSGTESTSDSIGPAADSAERGTVPAESGDDSRESEVDPETAGVDPETIGVETDESDDETGRTRAETTGPRIVPIRHEANRGVGGAITTGYRRALVDGIDVTAVMAGDGQMDPDHLDRLLDPIVDGQAVYAKGNRLLGREYHAEMSSFRLFGNITLSILTKISSGYWEMLDPQNGYTAISKEALEAIDLDSLYTDYGFTNDLLAALNTREFTIADVAMPAVYGDEQSHIEYHTFVPKLSWLLFGRFCRRLGIRYLIRDFHPVAPMYAVGALGNGAALAGIGATLRRRTESGSTLTNALLSALLFVVSTICLLLAMLFDREANAEQVVNVR